MRKRRRNRRREKTRKKQSRKREKKKAAQKEREDKKKEAKKERGKKREIQKKKLKLKQQKKGAAQRKRDDDESSTTSSVSYTSKQSRGSSLDFSFDEITAFSDIEDDVAPCQDRPAVETQADERVAIDDDAINKFFAVYYTEPKKQYYWGKVLKVFSDDEDLPVKSLEMTFVHRKYLSSMPETLTWHWPAVEDKSIIDEQYVFMGPCRPDLLKNGAYRFDDRKAVELFNKL